MFDFEMFFGRFHPLIVHIPIGFLLLAFLFKILDVRSQSSTYRPALKVTLMLSAVVTVVTCVSGFLLSRAGTYPEEELDRHQWAGILLATVTIGWYLLEFRWNVRNVFNYGALGITAVCLMVTGHRGGILTHGESYLWEGMPVTWQQFLGHDPYETEKLEFQIASLDSARVYEDIVTPILEARCYSCHSDRKQKGELRLDNPEMIRTGGESGDPLLTDELDQSKLYNVLTLPEDADEHMPPRGKTQLTKFEIEVIGSWIREGGSADLMVMEYQEPQALLAWYEDLMSDEKLFSNPLIPEDEVAAPDDALIEKLRDSGVLIQPLGSNTHYLEVSFINVPELSPALIRELASLREQVVWVDISGKDLTASHLDGLVDLPKITDLNLSGSDLPDGGLEKLSALKNIQILNLTDANIPGFEISQLESWPALRKVFTFQTGISPESVVNFRRSHPLILVDTGGYYLPQVPRDTLVFEYER